MTERRGWLWQKPGLLMRKMFGKDSTLKRLIAETVKTPGDRMYYASVAEQMQMGIFTSRLAAGSSNAPAKEAKARAGVS